MSGKAVFDYDLFVIGGVSGGGRAARNAAGEHGATVALAEEYRMGGTCVIRGCVPKKLMVFASSYRGAMADAQAYGWEVQAGPFDWAAFRVKLDAGFCIDITGNIAQQVIDGLEKQAGNLEDDAELLRSAVAAGKFPK